MYAFEELGARIAWIVLGDSFNVGVQGLSPCQGSGG